MAISSACLLNEQPGILVRVVLSLKLGVLAVSVAFGGGGGVDVDVGVDVGAGLYSYWEVLIVPSRPFMLTNSSLIGAKTLTSTYKM